MSELLRMDNFSFTYPQQRQSALQHITLSVEEGEFLVLCGPSGCGKTTLLRQLKPCLAPHGIQDGEVFFRGIPLSQVPHRQQISDIGFVQQSPEHQIVTDKVWHELAFGLESLGYDTATIRRRVAEMASFFGMQDWFRRDTADLSGGEKQLLALASVMVMEPQMLILDEPTAQLDPIAASDFLQMLGRIHRDLGTTILLTEHRLEEALTLADRAAVLESGKLLCQGSVREVGLALRDHGMFSAMPPAMRVWASAESNLPCPVTVQEGRAFLDQLPRPFHALPDEMIPLCGEEVLSGEELWYRYENSADDVVRGLSLTLHRGEFLALLGGNGVGKSTTLSLLSGACTPRRGTVKRTGRLGVLPQNPQSLFMKNTVRSDLSSVFDGMDLSPEEQRSRMEQMVTLCRLQALLDRHPYDLSCGEQQRAALAKVLLLQPDILLLDEPTKGLDAPFKQEFAGILKQLLAKGVAVLCVSHDVDFCAEYAHRAALFFDGAIVAQDTPRRFFSGNCFYTTAANRMAHPVCPEAITTQDVIRVIGGAAEAYSLPEQTFAPLPPVDETSAVWQPPKLPLWRKLLAAAAGLTALVIFFRTTRNTDLTELIAGTSVTAEGWRSLASCGVLLAALFVIVAAVGRRSRPPVQPPLVKRKLAGRTRVAAALILLCIPATLVLFTRCFGSHHYYLLAFLVLFECMTPFFLIFEGRRPQPRELTVIAVLCALGVAGRAAFFMLPQFKPVTALTIIAGVAFGGETGFLVGALTMLTSNVLFSQGPWTPFQMFAMGIIGFLAGILFRKGLLRRSRGVLCVFGTIATFVIYGGLMNPVSALLWMKEFRLETLLTYYITGFPADCVHAAATAFFLWVCADPMLEKLDRIKVKYGLVE